MTATLQINETEWITTTAYYARYFALYALLTRVGVKSEIHDCSISLARLLAKNGIIKANLVNDIAKSKQTRIDIQYYVEKQLSQREIKRNVEGARKFVLGIEKAIENITTEQIEEARTQLKKSRSTIAKP